MKHEIVNIQPQLKRCEFSFRESHNFTCDAQAQNKWPIEHYSVCKCMSSQSSSITNIVYVMCYYFCK